MKHLCMRQLRDCTFLAAGSVRLVSYWCTKMQQLQDACYIWDAMMPSIITHSCADSFVATIYYSTSHAFAVDNI